MYYRPTTVAVVMQRYGFQERLFFCKHQELIEENIQILELKYVDFFPHYIIHVLVCMKLNFTTILLLFFLQEIFSCW